jgi:hypothetical protein
MTHHSVILGRLGRAVLPSAVAIAAGSLEFSDPAGTDLRVALEIIPAKSDYQAGDIVEIDLLIRNVGGSPFAIFRSLEPEGHFIQFEISDRAGTPFYQSPSIPREETEAFLKDVLLLDPGYVWGKRFRFERTKVLGEEGARFPAGTYRVKARFFNMRKVRDDMPTGTWVSNEVEFRIVTTRK